MKTKKSSLPPRPISAKDNFKKNFNLIKQKSSDNTADENSTLQHD